MRVDDEASLTLDVAGDTLHLIVGPLHDDGTVPCHLLGENANAAAYALVLDLTGHLRHARAIGEATRGNSRVLTELPQVDPALWRRGLANGLRRRAALLEQLHRERTTSSTGPTLAVARNRAAVAALECDDPDLRTALAALAPGWAGSLDDLHRAARHATSGFEGS